MSPCPEFLVGGTPHVVITVIFILVDDIILHARVAIVGGVIVILMPMPSAVQRNTFAIFSVRNGHGSWQWARAPSGATSTRVEAIDTIPPRSL